MEKRYEIPMMEIIEIHGENIVVTSMIDAGAGGLNGGSTTTWTTMTDAGDGGLDGGSTTTW